MADVGAFLDLPYTKTVTRDDDGDFIAEVRELPGCIAHGATESEALSMLREAQAAWIEAVLRQGKQPPLPNPVLPSGKWLQRVPRYLHKRMIDAAEAEETSLNQLVTAMLVEGLATREITRAARAAKSCAEMMKPFGEAQPAPGVVAEDPSRPLQDLLQQPIEHLTALRDEMRDGIDTLIAEQTVQCWADKADTVLADLLEAAAARGHSSEEV